MRFQTLIAALAVPAMVVVPFFATASAAHADCAVPGVVTTCPTTPPPPPNPQPQPNPNPNPGPGPVPTPPPVPSPAPNPNPQPQPQPQPKPKPDTNAAAARLLQLLNKDRLSAGLTALTRRGDLDGVAVQHSRDMAAKESLWHNDDLFTPASHDRFGAKTLGENVAMNPDIDDMHQRLMNSPHHRANILDGRFSQIGMGVAVSPSGNLFATEDFLEPRPAPASRNDVARAVPGAKAPAVAAALVAVAAPVLDEVQVMPELPNLGGVPVEHRTHPAPHGRSRTAAAGFGLLSLAGLAGVGGAGGKLGLGTKGSTR